MNKTALNKQTEIPWPQIPDQNPGGPEGCSDSGTRAPKVTAGAPRRSSSTAAAAAHPANSQQGLGLPSGRSAGRTWGLSTVRDTAEVPLPLQLMELFSHPGAQCRARDSLRLPRFFLQGHAAQHRLCATLPRPSSPRQRRFAFPASARIDCAQPQGAVQTYCLEVRQVWVISS